MLSDPARCQVVLVTTPETTPVNELFETTEVLRQRVEVRLGPVVVNQLDDGPPLPDPTKVSFGRTRTHVAEAVAAAEFRRTQRGAQADELARIRETIGCDHIVLPAVPTAALDPSDIAALAARVL
jgi:hypothetical protein